MSDVIVTRNINILLPNSHAIKVECPELTTEEFDYFIKILMVQKQGLVIEQIIEEQEETDETQISI